MCQQVNVSRKGALCTPDSSKFLEKEKVITTLIPHSHLNLSCLRSGVDCSRFIGNDTGEELLTPLLRQPNFWCESGIKDRIDHPLKSYLTEIPTRVNNLDGQAELPT